MDPITLALMGAQFAAPIIGGLIAQAMSAGDMEEAERLRELAQREYDVPLPELEQVVARELEASQVTEDPALRNAQMNALDRFDAQSREGLTAVDRAALNDITQQQGRTNRANREAIQSQFARRGTLDSGMNLATQLQAQSEGAQLAQSRGLNVAAQGQRARESALDAFARLAGTVRGDDFRKSQDQAARDDAFSRFNEANRIGAIESNNRNAQWGFGANMDLADRRAGGLRDQAAAREGRAGDTRQMWGGVGAGVGQAAGAVQGYRQNVTDRQRDDDRWRDLMRYGRP